MSLVKYILTAMCRVSPLIATLIVVLGLGDSTAHADAPSDHTFTQADLKSWVLTAMSDMRATEPGPDVPWADTYDMTAEKIAKASAADPILGDTLRTAATMVVMGWYESRFKPDAVGDHGTSFGMWQAKTSTVKMVGCSKEDLFDPDKSAECTLKLLHLSFSACRRRPVNERLAQYAYGLDCDHRLGLSRFRMGAVSRLVKKIPLIHVEPQREEAPAENVLPTDVAIPPIQPTKAPSVSTPD